MLPQTFNFKKIKINKDERILKWNTEANEPNCIKMLFITTQKGENYISIMYSENKDKTNANQINK